MDTDKIIQDLNSRFAAPLPEFYQRRIIFWYDEDKEFEDKLDEVVLENAKVIAPFYEGISEQVTLDALKGMISVHRLLQASNPVKRWVVLTGMKVVGKYDMLHGLVANPRPNPKCVESGKQLEALYAKALPLAERLILEFVEKLDTDEPLDKAYDHTFGEF